MYTFYCCRRDGSVPSFEAYELGSDDAAATQATRLLAQHTSCSHVIVYDGEREVMTETRAPQAQSLPPLPLSRAVEAANAATSRAAVIVTDAAGSVVFWNEGATQLYGWSAEDALGANIMDVTPVEASHRKAASIMTALQAGRPWEGEITLKRRDGGRFAAFVADTPIGALQAGDGAILGISAPADQRRLVWQAQAEILNRLDAQTA